MGKAYSYEHPTEGYIGGVARNIQKHMRGEIKPTTQNEGPMPDKPGINWASSSNRLGKGLGMGRRPKL